MTQLTQEGFSADVRLELSVEGRSLEVAQVGNDSIILREEARDIIGKQATLSIQIGATRKVQTITLFKISPNRPHEVMYRECRSA